MNKIICAILFTVLFSLSRYSFAAEIKLPARTSIGILSSRYIDYRKECDDSNLKVSYKSELLLNGKVLNNLGKTLRGPISVYNLIDKGKYIVILYGSDDHCCNGSGCTEFPVIYVAKIFSNGNVNVINTKQINNSVNDGGNVNSVNIKIDGDKLVFPYYDEGPKSLQVVYDMNTAKLIRTTKALMSKSKEYCKLMYNIYSERLTDDKCYRIDSKTSKKVLNTNIIELFDECNACRGELAHFAKDSSELSRFNSFCIKSCKNNSIYNYETFKNTVCRLK